MTFSQGCGSFLRWRPPGADPFDGTSSAPTEGCPGRGETSSEGLRRSHFVVKIRLLLMSTTAILSGELYHESEETVLIRRALMEAAGQRILLSSPSLEPPR
jgi:hypothetical protein